VSEPPRTRPPSRRPTRSSVRIRRLSQLRGRGLRVVGIAVGCIALVVIVLTILALRRADQTLRTIEQNDPRRSASATANAARVPGGASATAASAPAEEPLPNALRDPVNVLLIGVDKRPNSDDGVRSDTLILVHLDPQQKWASMLSIPRDSVVNIPHLGQAKINAAYAYGYTNAAAIYGEGTEADAGGGALAAETVEQFLGVKVDYTAQVDFRGFEQLVDAIGGVLVDVERPLLDAEYPTEDYGVERIFIPAGLQVMSGRSALIYARSRHLSTDFDRGRRQQQVLRALLEQVKARGLLENITVLPEWADVLAQNVRTTLPVRDLGMLNGLASLARELNSDRVVQLVISPEDVPIDVEDGSDIYWNRAAVAALVARWRAGPQTGAAVETARVQVLNGAQIDGVATRVSDYLRERGFDLAEPGNSPQTYEHTTIIDYAGRPATLQRLADALGLQADYVLAQPGPDAPPPSGADIVVIVGTDYQAGWVGN
jgi:polyisoprenyl-teichoic acid--peptidoglycan teichoic acid transferase